MPVSRTEINQARPQNWNNRVFVKGLEQDVPNAFAGFFQFRDMLSVADVAHELGLFTEFDKPVESPHGSPHESRGERWQPALLETNATSCRLVVLDFYEQATVPDANRRRVCIQYAKLPKLRRDPRYMELGQVSTDPRFALVSVRSMKRSSSVASGVTTSSPARSEVVQGSAPLGFPATVARQYLSNFRDTVLSWGTVCSISGTGRTPGFNREQPGIEAAYIIPRTQWPTTPNRFGNLGNPDSEIDRHEAWRLCNSQENGLPLMNYVHYFYDLRFISIHPETYKIRVFVRTDLLMPLHNTPASVPPCVLKTILKHHWDMCCIENSAADWFLRPLPLSGFDRSPTRNTSLVGRSNIASQATESQASDSQASGAQPASDALEMQAFRLSSFQMLNTTAHPPSPPSSEPGFGGYKLWRLGHELISDQARAKELWREGYDIAPVIETDDPDEKCDRGRSQVKRSCVAALDNEDEESGDGMNKKQKLDPPVLPGLSGFTGFSAPESPGIEMSAAINYLYHVSWHLMRGNGSLHPTKRPPPTRQVCGTACKEIEA
ncbi:hypothetical protein VM1G_04948 [Cytospora mali]|uniref:HNH nuclease domain-containing protein n=1 Tax=Cytospora mali TaxID=578113 RepID=A0A194W1G5_CYTMA|nr:hypothetical protein VM1G_04948 [Valsa mali]